MDGVQGQRLLRSLIEELSGATTIEDLASVQKRGHRLFLELFRPDDRALDEINEFEPRFPRPSLILRAKSVSQERFERRRAELRAILANALFALELREVSSTIPVAAGPSQLEALRRAFSELLAEVDDSPLSPDERAQLRACLIEALRVVESAADGTVDSVRLRATLGDAMAQASRRRSSPLWRRVAEVVLVADAVLSIGSNVELLEQGVGHLVEVLHFVDDSPGPLELGPGEPDSPIPSEPVD